MIVRPNGKHRQLVRFASLRPVRIAPLSPPGTAGGARRPTKLFPLTITTRETNPHG